MMSKYDLDDIEIGEMIGTLHALQAYIKYDRFTDRDVLMAMLGLEEEPKITATEVKGDD